MVIVEQYDVTGARRGAAKARYDRLRILAVVQTVTRPQNQAIQPENTAQQLGRRHLTPGRTERMFQLTVESRQHRIGRGNVRPRDRRAHGAALFMVERVVAQGMPAGNNGRNDLGMRGSGFSNHKERGPYIRLLQQNQESRRMYRVGSIVKGQVKRRLRRFAAENDMAPRETERGTLQP